MLENKRIVIKSNVINNKNMYLISESIEFPNVELANDEPNGLLAIGGDLSAERLIYAYRNGIFPWYSSGEPILWWSPNPRSILLPKELIIRRSLRKVIRNCQYKITFDQAFNDVIRACAAPREDGPQTWLNQDMIEAYQNLHQLGYAHSVECWYADKLVGGLYGVVIDKVFFGESMFKKRTDASKCAFVYLVKHLEMWGFKLIDCQIQTSHLDSLGASQIARSDFIGLLNKYCKNEQPQAAWNSDIVLQNLLD